MPELPEVETVARDLQKILVGQKIVAVKSLDKKFSGAVLTKIKKAGLNKSIRRVFRRAKMLIIDCGQYFLVFHLKMTGQLIYRSGKKVIAGGHPISSTGVQAPNKFTRLVFSFKKGQLYFNDLRKFGWVKAVTVNEFKNLDAAAGLEPLSKSFTFKKFQELLLKRKKALIKAALLDQKLIAGLGNIYADEVLFRARIRPQRRVNTLSASEQKKLWQSIPPLLKKSIIQRGTTFSNFVDSAGLKGNFVSYLQVYGRGKENCKICGRPLKKTRLAGRGTHWCENCQK